MLNKLFEALYHKVFISIVVGRSQSTVYIEECKNDDVVKSDIQIFDTTMLDSNMYEFINIFTEESPFSYIAILDSSTSQGAIPTCNVRDMKSFYDVDSSKYICYKNRWTYFTSLQDIELLQKSYKKIGVDFIFSPFVVLANFFKDKIDNNLALYLLVEDNRMTLSVFDNGELLYGDYIDMEHDGENEELLIDDSEINDEELEMEDSIDLEDVDAIDDLEALDDFGDIEDLDTIDEIDEFAESEEIKDEEKLEDKIEEPYIEEVQSFNEDYQRYSFIQSSINRFYKEPRYNSKFIENIYIADSVGVSGDLKKYLEEEMFLSVFVRHLDLCAEVCELAKAELK